MDEDTEMAPGQMFDHEALFVQRLERPLVPGDLLEVVNEESLVRHEETKWGRHFLSEKRAR